MHETVGATLNCTTSEPTCGKTATSTELAHEQEH